MQSYKAITYQITKEAKSTQPNHQNWEKITTLKLKEDDRNLVDGGAAAGVRWLRRGGWRARIGEKAGARVCFISSRWSEPDLQSDTVGPYYGQFVIVHLWLVQTGGSVLYSKPTNRISQRVVWSIPTVHKLKGLFD